LKKSVLLFFVFFRFAKFFCNGNQLKATHPRKMSAATSRTTHTMYHLYRTVLDSETSVLAFRFVRTAVNCHAGPCLTSIKCSKCSSSQEVCKCTQVRLLQGSRVNPYRKTCYSKEVAKGSCLDLTERKEANMKRVCGSPSRWASIVNNFSDFLRTYVHNSRGGLRCASLGELDALQR
jgi:hypothetical protein